MSILTRSIGKSKDKAPVDPTSAPREEAPSVRERGGPAPALASSPRANLLPPEIGENQRRLAVRRGLRFVVAGAVVIAILGVGGAWYTSYTAQNSLAAAQAKSADLATQKTKYKDVVAAINSARLGAAAEKVGGSTDIDWQAYLQKLQGTLPEGVTLSTVTIDSADIQTPYAQSTTPLQSSRIASITFAAKSATLPSIPDWIRGLSTLPGYADADLDSISQDSGGFTAAVTMHLNTDAYSKHFDASKKGSGK